MELMMICIQSKKRNEVAIQREISEFRLSEGVV